MSGRRALLQTQFLSEKTRKVFSRLKEDPLLKGMTLVGGSAIALQIGHRISEDLDFTVFADQLPGERIDVLVNQLEAEGREVSLLTPQSMISTFRINTGKSLLNHVRDYVVDGAKIQFFAHGRSAPPRQLEYLMAQPLAFEFSGFNVLGIQGLFAMKTLVLGERSRSRDVYDLMTLIQKCGFTLDDALNVVKKYAPINLRDLERYKSVLLGLIPLDAEDEGFEGLGVAYSLDHIYEFFEGQVADYERRIAREILSNSSS